MFAHSFMLGTANNFLQTAAFSLFLVRFNSQTLAWVYILNALIGPLLIVLYMRLGGRLAFGRLLTVTLGFLLAVTTVVWLGLTLGAGDWLIFILPILFQVVVNLGNLEFWGLAARLYDVRQGKRLFGLVGAGQWLAIVLTGLLIPLLVGWMGTSNLLIFSVIGLAGAILFLGVITRHNAARLAGESAPSRKQAAVQKESTPSLFRNRYALLIFALVTLWWLAFFFLDNIFYDRAAAQYPGTEELASFLGIFLAVLGVITLITNTLVSGRVISSVGIRSSLMILPVLMVIGSSGMSLAGLIGAATLLFWLTMGTKLVDLAVGFSIDRAALTVLYQPIEAERRNRVQATAEGIFQPLANGLAGVGLLALGALFQGNRLPLIYALALISAAWLVVAAFIGREYPKVLTRALTRRRLGAADLQELDRSSLEMLESNLRSENPEEVVYALQMLEQAAPERLSEALCLLVDHPSETVRLETLKRIERMEMKEAVEDVRRQISMERSPEVRAQAVRALAQLDESDQTFELVSGMLEDPEPQVQCSAMVGLLRSGGIAGVLAAGQRLLKLAESPDPLERATAAQTLEEVGASNYYQPLIPLLQDPDLGVQRAALRAAGKLKNPRLWPFALEKLAVPRLRSEAATALASGGELALPGLKDAFEQEGILREVRGLILRICGRIGGEEVSRWLVEQVDDPDGFVRTQALYSLNLIRYQARVADQSRFAAQVQAEVIRAAEILAILKDLGDAEEVSLVREALIESLERARERVFLLLAMVYDRAAVLGARDNLRLASAERRAYAIEVLDVLPLGEKKREIFPLLIEQPSKRRERDRLSEALLAIYPQNPAGREQRLVEVIASPAGRFSPWTQACAIYCAGDLQVKRLGPILVRALGAHDPLLRETGVWALHRLEGRAARPQTRPLTEDRDPRVARMAQRMQRDHTEGIVLTIIEKVLALKKASIFGETPDEVLLQVAPLLEEKLTEPGEAVIAKGDLGDCMYILVDGEMRVHDGERTLNILGPGAVFGEIAVLDAEPRTASVTAHSEAQLLKLSQEGLYEVMDAYPLVGRGVIRALTHNLRERVQDVRELKAKIEGQPAGG